MSTTPLTPSPQVIMARCDIAEEDLEAYRRDEKTAIAERVAATACLVLVDGLRIITPVDDISARWHSVLHVLVGGVALVQGAQHGVEVEVRTEMDVSAGLGHTRLVAGEVRGDGPRHQEDCAVGEFLHPVGRRG